ncbi:hypothetical protein [Mangrovimicrobium sediminis]|uniref:hypothetical protein n=1 Tax=Mangrovimicrobium sediminis TaxID=2562682 RepID=UPI00197CE224|nr:hypothetical protein [Haliea sp. SAOS-164]
MDLQDFEAQSLYFDRPMAAEVETLLQEASEVYAEGRAEPLLLKAYALDPGNLSVLVALYRFYYYQHRYADAIDIADQVMREVAPMIDFPGHWTEISGANLANGLMKSFTQVRFYLLALKGAAYLHLRRGEIEQGVRMLNKVIELDSRDRLGAGALLRAMGPAAISAGPVAKVEACAV